MPALRTNHLSIARRSLASKALVATALALFGVGTLGCNKDDAPAAGKDPGKAEPAKVDAKDGKTVDAKPTPTGPVATPTNPTTPTAPADALQPPASPLQRGDVLGHVLFTNPSGFIKEVKSQIVPEAQASFVDESFIRTMAGGMLGARSKLATNLDLTKPMGCALVDVTTAPVPLVCVVGYTGGAAALISDLGSEGKQGDGAGHLAKFVVEGQELYIDEAPGGAMVSNSADAYSKGKSYVEANLAGRGPGVATDIEFVAFPGALSKRYEKELAPLLEQMGKVPPPSGAGALADAFASYTVKANAKTLETFRGMDQITFALGLEPAGVVGRFAMFPTPGSEMETQAKLTAAGPLDPTFVRNMPSGAWFVGGTNANIADAASTSMAKEMRTLLTDSYAEALGKDKAAVATAVDTFIAEARTTYSGHSAVAFMHEPGTVGALAIVAGLQPGVAAREGWKTWSAGFTPEAILGAEGAKKVTWQFQFDAAKAGSATVDRFVVELGEAEKTKLRAEGGATLAEWETKLGGLKLVFNRVEADGKVAWVLAPNADDKYTQAVVDALGGTSSLSGNAAIGKVLDGNPAASSVFAFNVKGMMGWLGELLPPEARAKMPPNIGNDLGDLYFAQSYGSTGAQSGEFVISQALVNQLRALAK